MGAKEEYRRRNAEREATRENNLARESHVAQAAGEAAYEKRWGQRLKRPFRWWHTPADRFAFLIFLATAALVCATFALYSATRDTLTLWMDRLRSEARNSFPEKVTAFRPEMSVHGRYGKPCPRCGEPIQRIRYADNETNYCARCQTGGKVLADRSLSRLLGSDWPRTLDELEALKRR